jgi:hypothetical protein
MSGHKKTKAKKDEVELPDLTDIYYAFSDARALVTVACHFITQKHNPGPAVSVLHLGVEALDRVSDQLEQAEIRFDRFRRKNAKVLGGAS